MTLNALKNEILKNAVKYCNDCRHLHHDNRGGATGGCDAFPNGIPKDVLCGKIDHRHPVKGDNGIRFEQKEL